MLLFLLLLQLSVTIVRSQNNPPIVTTPLGKVVGYHKTSFLGRKYEVYEGIPYAKPPIGNLRFQEPIPVSPWGTLNATYSKNECVQYANIAPDKNGQKVTEGLITGNEDCLYLSINVPVIKDKRRKLPVIFMIHGGSFQYGTGVNFGANNKYLADRDVIFVSINYRLGILGFLSTEDEVLPGNLGLKDQSVALRWTYDNIEAFGGDRTKITLAGFSAGGSSVHYHYLSPWSRGLFNSGIVISGTSLCPWGFALQAAEKAKKLGSIFNCPTDNSRSLISCLKNIPAQTLTGATKEFQAWHYLPEAPFAPSIEKAGCRPFINKSPEEIMRSGDVFDVPAIFGIVKDEGGEPGAGFAPHANVLQDLNDNWMSIAPYLLQYNYTLPQNIHDKVARAARRKYFGNRPIDTSMGRELIQLLTDVHYHLPIEKTIRLHAQAVESPVYLYYYSFKGSQSYASAISHTENDYGVCHCDDVLLVLENDVIDPSKTVDEMKMVNFFMDMWESIANNGLPKLKGVNWKPVKADDPVIRYLEIYKPNDYRMSGNSNLGQKHFWNEYGLPY